MRIVLVEVSGQSLGHIGEDLAGAAEEGVQHRPAAQQEAGAALLQPQLVPQPRVLQRQLERHQRPRHAVVACTVHIYVLETEDWSHQRPRNTENHLSKCKF